MRAIKLEICLGLVFAVFFILSYSSPAQSSENENHCFTCHTNGQKLIKITRTIAKSNAGKPGASAKTQGEG
ncbi:MAG: hypothetical protein HUK40_07875 [Desulfobacter sp.]|nr:hypothetical protein [Desulfobacter sp.]